MYKDIVSVQRLENLWDVVDSTQILRKNKLHTKKVKEAQVQKKLKVEGGKQKKPFPSYKQSKPQGGDSGQKRQKPNLTFYQAITAKVGARYGEKGNIKRNYPMARGQGG